MNTASEKWLELYALQQPHREVSGLNPGADASQFERIEALTGEKLPEQFKALYLAHDGEDEEGEGTLFGLGFMALKEVISDLEAAKQQLKPANRFIADPEASQKLTDQLVAIVLDAAKDQPHWEKIEFDCSANSFGGPYIYFPGAEHRDFLDLDNQDDLYPITKALSALEQVHYNWDEMEFTVLPDGTYTVERKDYDFSDGIDSWPQGAIKTKYFHHQWVPVFKDYGGNFIGIDLDPDVNGKKGQVIVFGRDENPQFVVAEDLGALFAFFVDRIKAHEGNFEELEFMRERHLHEVLKEILVS